jgi:hypothetical protein
MFKVDRSVPWIQKSTLLKTRVAFQGIRQAIELFDYVDKPDPKLLIDLLTNPEKVTVGMEVKPLGELER